MISNDLCRIVQTREYFSHRRGLLLGFHPFDDLLNLRMETIESLAFVVRFRVGLDLVEWEVINLVALLIDSIDAILAELLRETKRHLHPLIRILRQHVAGEAVEFLCR